MSLPPLLRPGSDSVCPVDSEREERMWNGSHICGRVMFRRRASLTLVRYLGLCVAALATMAWSQDVPVIQTNVTPVTVYQLKPAAATTALVYGNDFRVKLDPGQDFPDGPIMVRVFEGPRDQLIAA